jgi:hypothetical protein
MMVEDTGALGYDMWDLKMEDTGTFALAAVCASSH